MSAPRSRRVAGALALATAIAIPAEGLRQVAYYDPPGILTVCYGSTRNVEKGRRYTLDECRGRLDTEMLEAINAVERCVPGLPELVLAAFGDATYNLGERVACNKAASTAARHLADGRLREACEQLPRWDKARVLGVMVSLPGLTKRRAAERDLCLQGVV